MKTVYLVCATGIATSTMLRLKVESFLKKNGVPVQVFQYRVTELSPARVKADAIISTAAMPPEFQKVVPVLNGLPLITGVGEEQVLNQLLQILKSDREA